MNTKHYAKMTLLIVMLAGSTACSGPFMMFPGGALVGPEQSITQLNLPAGQSVVQLETNPQDPYSIHTNIFQIDGTLYLDPAPTRTWYEYLTLSPMVRIKTNSSDIVYTAQAIAVTDPAITGQFEAERKVFMLLPR